MTNIDDLRQSVSEAEYGTGDVKEVRADEVNEGRIFGLTAGERMILSIILFLAVTVLSIALLLVTKTIAL